MDDDKRKSDTKGHLFTIEILMEGATNGLALEKLLRILNTEGIKDYKVKSGIELGKLIDLNIRESVKQALPQHKNAESKEEPELKKETDAKTKKQTAPATGDQDITSKLIEQLDSFKKNNALIRLTVIKGKGVKLNIPCRILNYDHDTQNVSVYHVDEKTVYLFKLNEIDDFVIG
jgi:hypothetical protein